MCSRLLFLACAEAVQACDTITLEVWDQGFLTDTLLSKAYLELSLCSPEPESESEAAKSTTASELGATTATASKNAATAKLGKVQPNRMSRGGGSNSTAVQSYTLALLPASSKPAGRASGPVAAGLRRSSKIVTLGDLSVDVWWVAESACRNVGEHNIAWLCVLCPVLKPKASLVVVDMLV